MHKDIILLGGGGHCKSCIDVIEQEDKYRIIGILDILEKKDSKILNYHIIGQDADIIRLSRIDLYALVTIGHLGSPKRRIEIFNLLNELNVKMAIVQSPFAYVSKHAQIGKGTIIMHHAQVNVGAIVGENCIINSKALIEHDASVGNQCHISTGAIINGGVMVGNNCFIGSNATTKQYISIPENSFIKANSLTK